jgi:DNA-binding SARP family transcriptional activator
LVEFRILGPLEVTRDRRPVKLSGARPRAVLALLLLHANRPLSADRLVDELWGADPPASARSIVHNAVSELRKTLGGASPRPLLETLPAGYVLNVPAGACDLDRFETLIAHARDHLGSDDATRASQVLREALALWRGDALADFTYEPFAAAAIARLGELRLLALELRIEADLQAGGAADLIAELQTLVVHHPVRERLRCLLMLALYRSGRQVESLQQARSWRRTLVDDLGIDPGPAVQQLEQRILRQDRDLDGSGHDAAPSTPGQTVLLAVAQAAELAPALATCEPLARSPHDLVIAQTVSTTGQLRAVAADLELAATGARAHGLTVRTAAFASDDPGRDLSLLARDLDVALLLQVVSEAGWTAHIDGLLRTAQSDVGLVRAGAERDRGAVLAAFGGSDHDWAAVEIAAWWASAWGAPLELFGTKPDAKRGASRLLATASLVVQRFVGIPVTPVLGPPGAAGLAEAGADARLVVVGVSERWQSEGAGDVRRQLLGLLEPTVVLVRRGLRPGALAPADSLTRFTWSLGGR